MNCVLNLRVDSFDFNWCGNVRFLNWVGWVRYGGWGFL